MATHPTRARSAAPIPYFFHDGVVVEVAMGVEPFPVRGSASTSVHYIMICIFELLETSLNLHIDNHVMRPIKMDDTSVQ